MHPDTIFNYTMLTLAATLFFALIAMSRLALAIHRDAKAERKQRSLWSQLFASARQWEADRKKNAIRAAEESRIHRLRTGAK